MRSLAIRVGLVLVGEELEASRDKCVFVENGVVSSISSYESCPEDSTGGRGFALVPQPGNAHVHSADHAFPEYGLELKLEELVAPPRGLKHRLLESTPEGRLVEAIAELYSLSWRTGLGLVIDFREGGGEGCRLAQLAKKKLRGLEVLVLGRPGPGWPEFCEGLGLASPLGFSLEKLRELVSLKKPAMTHVAETVEARRGGDFELALAAGFDAIVHGTHLSREDLEVIAEKRVGLIACPRSNLWHSVGSPPIADALKAGVLLALGTDNASWSLPDIWEEARVAFYLARLQGEKSERVPREVLKAVMVNPYVMIGRKPPFIEEGSEARALLVLVEGYGVLNSHNIYAALVKRVGVFNIVARIDGSQVSWLRV
ncbi:MAG: amidohydrolase family protein [Acidilobaceae archaeon]